MINEKQFNNYLNVVINAIDAEERHHDEATEKIFTDHGRWALHSLENKCSDKERQNVRRWLNGKPCVYVEPDTCKEVAILIGYDCEALYRFLVYCDKLDHGELVDEVFIDFLTDLIRMSRQTE